MISHNYQCIFIHISKCAGTSIENAFGIDTDKYNIPDYESLFGWSEKYDLWLQHATPQQLFDLKLINKEIWDKYYKLIVYRNSWSRAYSDFFYLKSRFGIGDSFYNFLNGEGEFFEILNKQGSRRYVGDHLNAQVDYFFLNGQKIKYDTAINFDELQSGLVSVCNNLNLPHDFFNYKKNVNPKNKGLHYSKFYNAKRKRLVVNHYKRDIDFFNFKFDEQKTFIEKMTSYFINY